ncbi:MAG: UDP-N-acetylglucosamine--N-acetylmuramyl-(pentapeptide) pyrophosphoryl-undecaprenol N-acetylglucosamine transferase [Puniceicoccales bacterium]|jgi:UDP-N-acetylglucosamine--N-acetylmuramyl-(pentapeptide) pyrophosphoryl-undecaprenol N-acetylglucosamine transferase|nr:UDP-N-acetylglucosamine--N-acetylmuramyl-(pentapeptide) pyrophosphoryl-undecaprenol N-acetylglucosamine transferase [Puniceicoccales bacterium]
MNRYAIVCGGTGGHLGPGIAIAEELMARNGECLLLISDKVIDSVMLKKYGQFEYVTLSAKPLAKSIWKIFETMKSQLISLFRCIKLVKNRKIDCVIGMGGFTNFPAIMAAFLMRKKIVLHESNRVIGKSIKLLACLADIIFLPPHVNFKSRSLNKKVSHASIPLRREMRKIDKCEARARLGLDPLAFVVTVLGGSQGANALNEWAIRNFQRLNGHNLTVCCVRGIKSDSREEIIGMSGDGNAIRNLFLPFCSDMSSLLSATDLLVCRAGAGTIAEATLFGLPMVLVPYPDAAENHQEVNATQAANDGRAIVVRQGDIDLLANVVIECFQKNLKNFQTTPPQDNEHSAVEVIVNRIQRMTGNE